MSFRILTIALLPAASLLLAHVAGADVPARLFRADLAALVVAVMLGAFAVRPAKSDALAAGASVVLVAANHVIVGGAFAGGVTLAALLLGAGGAAFGIRVLAQALRAPESFAATLACVVLSISMSALFWADPVADRLAEEARFPFREAALQLDLATAAAYGAADYDRLHDASVYQSVALASSTHRAPTGLPTAGLWGSLGALCAALGLWLRRPAAGRP